MQKLKKFCKASDRGDKNDYYENIKKCMVFFNAKVLIFRESVIK